MTVSEEVYFRSHYSYSLLKAEQYNGHKLTARPIWRILICTFNCIGLLSAILIVQFFIS